MNFVNIKKIGHRYVIQYFHLKGFSPITIKVEQRFWSNEDVRAAKTNTLVVDHLRCPRQKRLKKPQYGIG